MRTHASEDDKPLKCGECDKRFWTNQHLKKHVEVVHEGKTYDVSLGVRLSMLVSSSPADRASQREQCPSCPLTFRKHNLLRTHVAEAHSPPGTKPFICDHKGCDKSFKQMVHLKAHAKIHDRASALTARHIADSALTLFALRLAASRYLCHHPSCIPLPLASRQYPTWSTLQRHTKTAHPPTCPHPECKGRTFTSNRGLKGHLANHDKKEGVEESQVGKKRRRDGERGKAGGRKRRKKGRSSEDETTAQETELETDGGGAAPLSPILGSPVEGLEEDYSDQEQDPDDDDAQEASRDARMVLDFAWGGKRKRKIGARMRADAEGEEADGEENDDEEVMEQEQGDEFGPSSPWKCDVGYCTRRFKSVRSRPVSRRSLVR